MFAPNYKSPRSVQINLGIQHEIRHGLIFSADYLRNVETHALLGIDLNRTGAARYFSLSGAQAARPAEPRVVSAFHLQFALDHG